MQDERTATDRSLRDSDVGPSRAGEEGGAGARTVDDDLLRADAATAYTSRWEQIQIAFVDDPRTAVEQADALVQDLVGEITRGFARQREALEAAWGEGDDASTEDLRLTLQAYRSFFGRLLDT
jgi:hypothetical protein